MKIIKIILSAIVFLFLTVISQTGGIIYLLCIPLFRYSHKKFTRWKAYLINTFVFLFIYMLSTFVIVPIIAKPLGRVPLPINETAHLKPSNVLTCLLNRHYVKKELKELTTEVAGKMNQAFPGTTVSYLDAGFPFMDGFPLIPHLSHNDGRKLDLAFFYIDPITNTPLNDAPSFIGYGICEEPRPGEDNTAAFCKENGYWQYSFLKKIVPQSPKKDFLFDSSRTKLLTDLFVADPKIGKVFIEPHLKKRLNLINEKVRFHGCGAVRHDDHLHVQLK